MTEVYSKISSDSSDSSESSEEAEDRMHFKNYWLYHNQAKRKEGILLEEKKKFIIILIEMKVKINHVK